MVDEFGIIAKAFELALHRSRSIIRDVLIPNSIQDIYSKLE